MANVLAAREAWTLGLLKWITCPSSLIMFTCQPRDTYKLNEEHYTCNKFVCHTENQNWDQLWHQQLVTVWWNISPNESLKDPWLLQDLGAIFFFLQSSLSMSLNILVEKTILWADVHIYPGNVDDEWGHKPKSKQHQFSTVPAANASPASSCMLHNSSKKKKSMELKIAIYHSTNYIQTSSMPGIELTDSFFNELCNFLSSVVAVLWMTFFFLLAEPCTHKI